MGDGDVLRGLAVQVYPSARLGWETNELGLPGDIGSKKSRKTLFTHLPN